MTTAYDNAAAAFSKQVQWLVEIDLPRCAENYNTAPCNPGGGVGDLGDGLRCHYTFSTCQDQTNFNLGTRTYRFCLHDVPWPDPATTVYPLLRRRVPIPQRVQPTKLSVFPEEVRIEMLLDFTPPAQDTDKTLHNTSTAGEFWKNLKARHPNYAGKDVRVLRGFNTSGFVLADFAQVGPTYTMKAFDIDKNGVTLTAESPLKRLDERKTPWVISEDNVLTANVAASGADNVEVTDASEYPNPADFTQDIFIEVESEIMLVTSIAGNNLAVGAAGRGMFGTTETGHTADGTIKADHVLAFAQDVSPDNNLPVNALDVIQDLLEWANIGTSKLAAATFTNVQAGAWPEDDVRRVVRKSEKVAKHIQQLREPRGLIIYVDAAGTFSVAVMAPNASAPVIDDDSLVQDSIVVTEDAESRITRASMYYSPTKDSANDPDDFSKAVVLINAELEGANVFGDKKEEQILDLWVYNDGTNIAQVRSLLKRLIARRAYGERRVKFDLEVKDATYSVGSAVTLKTRHITDPLGTIVARPLLLVARGENERNTVTYEGIDVNYSGRFLRIGPDTMAADYDNASDEDKAFGYWGDADNRVGQLKEEGYRFW